MKLLNTDELFGDARPRLISLQFKGEYAYLEEEFVREYLRKSAKVVRYTFIIGLIFYSLFGVLDALIVPAQKYELWMIRYGFVVPFLILSIVLTLYKPFIRFIEALGVLVLLVAGSGISVMGCHRRGSGKLLLLHRSYPSVDARIRYAQDSIQMGKRCGMVKRFDL